MALLVVTMLPGDYRPRYGGVRLRAALTTTEVPGVRVALLHRRNAEDYCQEALGRLRARDYAGALAAADRAIGITPEHPMAHHLRGAALSDLGRHEAALDSFRQVIAVDPTMTYVQYRIALELNFLRLNAEALEATDAAIGLNPDDSAPLILRGAILFDLERYEQALDAFTSALQREPGIGQVRFDRAQVLRKLGRYPEALADYDQALRLVPGLTSAREQKGITLAMAGQYDDALTEFGMATAAATGRSTQTADVWSAAIAWHRDDPREAHRLFEQAAGKPMGMNRCESVNMQAVVSCALGNVNSAADLLRGQADTANPAIREVLSRLYDLLGDPPMPGIDRLRAIALGS